MSTLSDPSSRAIDAVQARAARVRRESLDRLDAVFGNRPARELETMAASTLAAGRVTLNFHPDRIGKRGLSVAAGLLADGRYHSQWITGLSNGSRSALAGGDRHRWEHVMFDGAYDDPDLVLAARPVYGSLDLLQDPHGGSPRFGSSYVVLRPSMVSRTTFCVGDSHVGARDVGTVAQPLSLFAGLAEQASARHLLDRPLGVTELLAVADGSLRLDRPSRCIDGYVEAQVHGEVDLTNDVESIVVDPSFRGTEVERDLAAAARRHRFTLEWHGGSEIEADDIPEDFRGRTVRELGRGIARADGLLDAATIGRAAAATRLPPATGSGDEPSSALQQLKYLWHALFVFGHDAEP